MDGKKGVSLCIDNMVCNKLKANHSGVFLYLAISPTYVSHNSDVFSALHINKQQLCLDVAHDVALCTRHCNYIQPPLGNTTCHS